MRPFLAILFFPLCLMAQPFTQGGLEWDQFGSLGKSAPVAVLGTNRCFWDSDYCGLYSVNTNPVSFYYATRASFLYSNTSPQILLWEYVTLGQTNRLVGTRTSGPGGGFSALPYIQFFGANRVWRWNDVVIDPLTGPQHNWSSALLPPGTYSVALSSSGYFYAALGENYEYAAYVQVTKFPDGGTYNAYRLQTPLSTNVTVNTDLASVTNSFFSIGVVIYETNIVTHSESSSPVSGGQFTNFLSISISK
jgi:hypothetical protein